AVLQARALENGMAQPLAAPLDLTLEDGMVQALAVLQTRDLENGMAQVLAEVVRLAVVLVPANGTAQALVVVSAPGLPLGMVQVLEEDPTKSPMLSLGADHLLHMVARAEDPLFGMAHLLLAAVAAVAVVLIRVVVKALVEATRGSGLQTEAQVDNPVVSHLVRQVHPRKPTVTLLPTFKETLTIWLRSCYVTVH
ncbi:hypothetical protein BDV25DRAFT_167249, partial [Aspergillus avenaceus]